MLRKFILTTQLKYQSYRCRDKQVGEYYSKLLPLLNLPIRKLPMLALDLEMTGLDPKKDQIISIGIIPIVKGQIKLNQGQHRLIKIEGSVGQSATIHGLVDNDLENALPLGEALQWLLKQITGKVLIAHNAPMDLSFIEQALFSQANIKARLFAIDTLQIEYQRLLRKQPMIKEGEIRLTKCRERYNLPNYDAHNALVDALSCAELLLAQVSKMGGLDKIKASELMR